MYFGQVGTGGVSGQVNPVTRVSVRYPWIDLNGDKFVQANEFSWAQRRQDAAGGHRQLGSEQPGEHRHREHGRPELQERSDRRVHRRHRSRDRRRLRGRRQLHLAAVLELHVRRHARSPAVGFSTAYACGPGRAHRPVERGLQRCLPGAADVRRRIPAGCRDWRRRSRAWRSARCADRPCPETSSCVSLADQPHVGRDAASGGRAPCGSARRSAGGSRTAADRACRPSCRPGGDRCPPARRPRGCCRWRSRSCRARAAGSNARMYGSSDVSATLNVRSASISSLSATVPEPETARRGDAASSFNAIRSLLMLMSPVTVPMPSSATKKSRTAPCTSYRGASNVPLPPAVKSSRPDSGGAFGDCADRQALDRNALHVEVELIGAVPADVGGAGPATAAFDDDDVVEADAFAFETETRGRGLERLVVGDAIGDRHRAEADTDACTAVDVELARQQAVHADSHRARTRDADPRRALGDADPGVDLFAVVAARIAEREPPVGEDRRVAGP